MSDKSPIILPVCRAMCLTCPFREGSPYAFLKADLIKSATEQASRICHSTGERNAINFKTGKPPRLCRGARDVQLRMFCELGVIEKPTDKAWAAKVKELGIG